MSAVAGTAMRHPAAAARMPAGRPPLLTRRWPLHAVLVSFPLAWALGLAGFVWYLAAIPMSVTLLRARRVRVPSGFGIWLLFLAWMLLTAIQIDGAERMVGFAYRAAAYLSATVWFLYVYSAPGKRLPTARVVASLTAFGAVVVAGGWLGVVAPTLSFVSPVERLLPQALLNNGFVYELVHPASATVQDFLGYPVGRPKAPFPYANDWGGALGLLAPFLVLSALRARSAGWRLLAWAALALAVVPVVVSLNRALWASLALVGAYVAVRLALRGRSGVLWLTGLAAGALVALVILTPLRVLVSDRLETPHSNDARTAIIAATLEEIRQSPWLGYGGPRPFGDRPLLPSLGTQGHLWLVPFSHGVIGAVLFAVPVLALVWRTRRWRSWSVLACHASLLIAVCELPFYDFLPAQLHLVAIAGALGLRDLRGHHRPAPRLAPLPRVQPVAPVRAESGEQWLLELLWPAPGHRITRGVEAETPGWSQVAVFGAFGIMRSRLLIPLQPHAAASATLRRFHYGTSATVWAAKSAAAAGFRFGLLQPLVRDRVRVLRQAGVPASAGIDGYLTGVLQWDHVVVAPSFGPPRFNRKPVLQVLDPSGMTLAYAKIGFNAVTRRLVEAEARFLAGAPDLPLRRVRVPRLLHHGTWQGLDVLVLTALPAGFSLRGDQPALLTEAAAEVAALHGVTMAPLGGSAYWEHVRTRMVGLEGSEPWLAEALDVLDRKHAGTQLAYGTWHGDWGPWNIGRRGDELLVWDWERTAQPVPLGFDVLHLYFQHARFREGLPPLEAAARALDRAAKPLTTLGVDQGCHRLVFTLYAIELVLRDLEDRRLLETEGPRSFQAPPLAAVVQAYLLREPA